MSEFIGARISLISKSDIRYVGTLHEINSENSTVALENVKSYGTEGRRGVPASELPPSDSVYEYIVFRGSDVKDLRVEDAAKEETKAPPSMPNDPAILGSARPSGPPSQPPQQQSGNGPFNQPPNFPPPGPYSQYQQYPQPRFGGPVGPYAFPSGGPPNMPYPPPGYQGRGPPFPPGPGPFGSGPGQPPPHFGMPGGPQPQFPSGQPPSGGPKPAQELPEQNRRMTPAANDKPTASAPTPPIDSKPPVEAAMAPPAGDNKPVKIAKKVYPAMPLPNQRSNQQPVVPLTTTTGNTPHTAIAAASGPSQATSTEAATAAVAAAMAKLQPGANRVPNSSGPMDNLTQKVDNLRLNSQQHPRGIRGIHRGRGGARRGNRQAMEVPKDDFDFESANAKFNKDDLVKEAIGTGSPITSPNGEAPALTNGSAAADVVIPAALYNKTDSFFDNISSEAKDKEDGASGRKSSIHDMRNEERKRNMETFGMGSVEHAFGRGGYRGRGRGRGYRGRGTGFRGRGGAPRGGENTTLQS